MKNIVYFIISFLILVGCSKNDSNDKESIIGKWQLIEYCENDGGGTWGCTDIENGYTVQFKESGDFIFSEGNSECLTGTFTYNSEELILQFNSNVCSENDGIVVYDYSFIDTSLKLSLSVENANCTEGCYEVFNRIPFEE
jgi:hypothetical protein